MARERGNSKPIAGGTKARDHVPRVPKLNGVPEVEEPDDVEREWLARIPRISMRDVAPTDEHEKPRQHFQLGVDALIESRSEEVHRRAASRDTRPFEQVASDLGRVRGRMVRPAQSSPDWIVLLDAFVEVARLIHAAVRHDDASLFDFEVEALHQLSSLAERTAEMRQVAVDAAVRARCHLELVKIYADVVKAWPTKGESTRTTSEVAKRQREAVLRSEARLRSLVDTYQLPSTAVAHLALRGDEIRALGGPSHAAQKQLHELEDRPAYRADRRVENVRTERQRSPRPGHLRRARRHVSGYYQHRATEDAFPDARDQDDLARNMDEMAWLWSRIYELQALAGMRRGQRSPDTSNTLRTLMFAEQCLRGVEDPASPQHEATRATLLELQEKCLGAAPAATRRPRSSRSK